MPDIRLNQSPLCIVDVETTGGGPFYDRVIEIGMLRIERGKVRETFRSLVNPHQPLSPFIRQLTGISPEELEQAPSFEDIAGRVAELALGAVFVAHNAPFDYSFVKQELTRAGIAFQAPRLCTARLSRRLYPRYRHHNLSALILRHGLIVKARHRAYDDAKALWDFIRLAEAELGRGRVEDAIRELFKLGVRPAELGDELIASLHDGPGVYMFKDQSGRPLYVGKSVNIKDRIFSHFQESNLSSRKQEMIRETRDIECLPCVGELEALLLEVELIKELEPLYNIRSRKKRAVLWLENSKDAQGFRKPVLRETPMEAVNQKTFLGFFKSRQGAEDAVRELAADFLLCAKVLGIERMRKRCFAYELGKCAGACAGEESPSRFNERFDLAFKRKRLRAWPYKGPVLIKESTLHDRTKGVGFIVDNWRVIRKIAFDGEAEEEKRVATGAFDWDLYKILLKALNGGAKNLVVQPL